MKPALAAAAFLVAACANSGDRRETMGDQAMATARQRAACAEAKATVLGRTALPIPASYAGPDRIQYTIGIDGCGKNVNVVVVCAAGTPCEAIATDSRK
jgi:hypothetical protein